MNLLKKILRLNLAVIMIAFLFSCEKGAVVTSTNGFDEQSGVQKISETAYTINYGNTDLSKNSSIGLVNLLDELFYYVDDKFGVEMKNKRYYLNSLKSGYRPGEANQIFINNDDISYHDVVLHSLISEFGSGNKYGLLYGYTSYLIDEFDLDTYVQNSDLTTDELSQNLHLLQQDIVCFEPSIATNDEMRVSSQIANQVVNYILSEYSEQFLINLIKSKDYGLYERVISKWISTEYPTVNMDNHTYSSITFSNYYKDDSILFETHRINWSLNLLNNDWEPNFNEEEGIKGSSLSFYNNVSGILGSIQELEEKMLQRSIFLPELDVFIYNVKANGSYSAQFISSEVRIDIGVMDAFEHEYVHFIDYALGIYGTNDSTERFRSEMRAVYYSFDTDVFTNKYNRILMYYINYLPKEAERHIKAIKVVNKISMLEQDQLEYRDVIDLIHLYSSSPIIEDVKAFRTDYNVFEWISLMVYMETTFGVEETNQMTLTDQFPNGRLIDWDKLEQEWKDFLVNNYDE